MFILQRDIINRAHTLKDYLSQKPSSSRVLRSVPPSLTLLSVICWVPFCVVSRPFFSTNTRKSPSRDTWSKKGICCPKIVLLAEKGFYLAGSLPHGLLHQLLLPLQSAHSPLGSQNPLHLHLKNLVQFFWVNTFKKRVWAKKEISMCSILNLHQEQQMWAKFNERSDPQIWAADSAHLNCPLEETGGGFPALHGSLPALHGSRPPAAPRRLVLSLPGLHFYSWMHPHLLKKLTFSKTSLCLLYKSNFLAQYLNLLWNTFKRAKLKYIEALSGKSMERQ